MLNEIDTLAQRVQKLADLAQNLRSHNQSLRQQVAQNESEIQRLTGLLAEARERVQAIIDRLPGEDLAHAPMEQGAH